jgi:hypothetical protein
MLKRIVLGLLLGLVLAFSGQSQNPTDTQGDDFAPGTVWFNTEWPMSVQMFHEKMLLVMIWHPECIEARRWVLDFQDLSLTYPQIQLVSLFPGDTLHPYSRSEVNGFIQEFQLKHPVGICPNFNAFQSTKVDRLPIFMLYQQSELPTLVSNDGSSPEEIMQTLKDMTTDRNFLNTVSAWAVGPSLDPSYYGDPLIEYPRYIEGSNEGYPVFVTEPSHQRIVVVNDEGVSEQIVGSIRGYQDGTFMSSRFNFPAGTSYDSESKLLFIADTDNSRVRVADFSGKIVYNLIGNGKVPLFSTPEVDGPMQSLGLPTDVAFSKGTLYVLSGATNQLFEADAVSGKAEELVQLPTTYWQNGLVRVYPKNLSLAKEGIYIVMSDGTVYLKAGKKLETIYKPSNEYDRVSAIVSKSKSTYLCKQDGSQIDVKKGNEYKKLSGSGSIGWQSGSADETSFNKPTDMTYVVGDLMVCDRGNHLLRTVSTASGKSRTLRFKPTEDLVYSMDALTYGDPVIFDSVFVAPGRNSMKIKIDWADFELVNGGRNEVFVNEMDGPTLESNTVTKDGFACKFETEKITSGLLQFELYFTVSPIANPDLIIQKRVFINMIMNIVEGTPISQEVVYQPKILPY